MSRRHPERQRLFVAILLPPEVEQHLAEAVDPLRTALPELRWVHPSGWHVTLEFLGECGPHEKARQLDRWQKRAARAGPLRLSLQGAGTFPRTTRAKVFWTGLAGDVDRWRKLAAFDQDAHVTLARARKPRDLTGLVDSLSAYAGPSWTVETIALVASHLGVGVGRGPRYEPLEYLALR